MATIDVEVTVTVTLPDILGEIKLTREQAMELRDSLNAAFPVTTFHNTYAPGVRRTPFPD